MNNDSENDNKDDNNDDNIGNDNNSQFSSIPWQTLSIIAHTFVPIDIQNDFEAAKRKNQHPLTFPPLIQAFCSTFALQTKIVESIMKQCGCFLYRFDSVVESPVKGGKTTTRKMIDIPDGFHGYSLMHKWISSEAETTSNKNALGIPVCSLGLHCAAESTACKHRVLTRLDRGRCECRPAAERRTDRALVCADCGICRKFCAPKLTRMMTGIRPMNLTLMKKIELGDFEEGEWK